MLRQAAGRLLLMTVARVYGRRSFATSAEKLSLADGEDAGLRRDHGRSGSRNRQRCTGSTAPGCRGAVLFFRLGPCTSTRDGWRAEPAPDLFYQMAALPTRRLIRYQLP